MVRFKLDKLDYMYFATYALILSGIVISVAELIANFRSRDILAKRRELFGRVFQPFVFLPQSEFLFISMLRSATRSTAKP